VLRVLVRADRARISRFVQGMCAAAVTSSAFHPNGAACPRTDSLGRHRVALRLQALRGIQLNLNGGGDRPGRRSDILGARVAPRRGHKRAKRILQQRDDFSEKRLIKGRPAQLRQPCLDFGLCRVQIGRQRHDILAGDRSQQLGRLGTLRLKERRELLDIRIVRLVSRQLGERGRQQDVLRRVLQKGLIRGRELRLPVLTYRQARSRK
jgi:hypothetical protein